MIFVRPFDVAALDFIEDLSAPTGKSPDPRSSTFG